MNGILNFEGQPVRMVVNDGEPWWVARDVCSILSIANSRDALARLDDDEKGVVTTDTLGGPQEVATVSESGLYALIFQSRKESAREFRRWVTREVLPSIRRTGAYVARPQQPQPLAMDQAGVFTGPGLTRKLVEVDARLARLERTAVTVHVPRALTGRPIGRPPILREQVEIWLRTFLANGPRKRTEILEAAYDLGWTWSTLHRVAKSMGMYPSGLRDGKEVYWSL